MSALKKLLMKDSETYKWLIVKQKEKGTRDT